MTGKAMIGGEPIPASPDLRRMRSQRVDKLQLQMVANRLDGLLLLGTSAVAYATGAVAPAADASHAIYSRSIAVLAATDPFPHLFTPYPEGAPPEMPSDHVHSSWYPELDEGVGALVGDLADIVAPGGRLGCDERTQAMRGRLGVWQICGGSSVMAAAKLAKTPDELACIRETQRINELAMRDTQPMLRPGCRQSDLSARFLDRAFALGAISNCLDPIWQVMPLTRAAGPWTTHGDVAFPTGRHDQLLRHGDVVWVDTGISYQGYTSDFGRTWIVGEDGPSRRQRDQYARWSGVVTAALGVCRPGATGRDLCQAAIAANRGEKPWIEHFYLAHGVGTDSAEMPLIGTDLGDEFDAKLVLQPGMVLVLEPVIWDDGAAGYRSEDIVAVTDDGWVPLSAYPYDPFGAER